MDWRPSPPRSIRSLRWRGSVCRRIGARCKEVQPDRAVYQFPGLLLRYRNDLHWGRFDQAMERMETMAALALSVVLRECKQMGTALTTEQGVRFLESHILPHQNRGILKNRADEIAMQFQSVLAKNNCRGIRTQAEKKRWPAHGWSWPSPVPRCRSSTRPTRSNGGRKRKRPRGKLSQ